MSVGETGKLRVFNPFHGFNIPVGNYKDYDVDLYAIIVIGQVRKSWEMGYDFKHLIIRMTRAGEMQHCHSDKTCTAMVVADYSRVARKRYSHRMDDRGRWDYIVTLLKQLSVQLENCISEGKETACFFRDPTEDSERIRYSGPIERISAAAFFANDVDPCSGAPATNAYRKDKAFFRYGEHAKPSRMTIEALKTSPTDFRKQLKDEDIERMDIPVTGTVMEDMCGLFADLSSVENLSIPAFRLRGGKRMEYMFRYCYKLRHLDLSGLDTSRITSMTCMFHGCRALKALDLSGFDTSQVKSMNSMFDDCASLEMLDLSGFDFSHVTNMAYMFSGCTSLREVIFSDTVYKACGTAIRYDRGRTREVETWNPLDAHTRQQAEIQGIIYKTTVKDYVYGSVFGATEEKRREYLGLGADVKITVVPHRGRR